MNKIESLKDIPYEVFREYSMHDKPEKEEEFRVGATLVSVKICIGQDGRKDGPFTLAYIEETVLGQKPEFDRTLSTTLGVYSYLVKTKDFDPRERSRDHSIFSLEAGHNPKPHETMGSVWHNGKGYWVEHYLNVGYYENAEGQFSVVSKFDDKEFAFLLNMQLRAHELAASVHVRGHWEKEWDPTRDFSQKNYGHY